MPTVNVASNLTDPTHDISLEAPDTTKYGLIFSRGGTRVLQEFPLSPPAQAFENEQVNWIGGRGRIRYTDDPTGYADDFFLWSTTEEKLMPSLQWRFANNVRTALTSLPGDNHTLSWWKLYGNTPASDIARYLSTSTTPGSTFNADKGYLIIRRRGTPGTLTFEICSNSSGDPGTVLKTVTKTTSNITDTISVYQLFDWSSTESLSSGTVYHVKVYGAATDNAANHWEVLTNAAGTSSKYSSDNSTWAAAGVSLYYRITDADIARQWKFFVLEGMQYAASINENGAVPVIINNGVRGTATSATATTLTCSSLSMGTNFYAGAYIKIYDGVGETQVRQITSNTADTFTVPTWGITPDSTSRFVVYYTEIWNTTTGTSGFTVGIYNQPVSTGTIAYFPSFPIRRMRVNANSHDFAADSTNYAHALSTNVEGATLKVYAGFWDSGTIKIADAKAWGTDLTFGAAKPIGTSDVRITNIYPHNRVIYIFKEDGLYSYQNGIVEKLGGGFGDIPDRYMGIGVGAQNQYLWFGWAHSVERMLGSSIDDMLNFKRGYDGIPANRRGNISSIVSAVGWLFFVVDGGASNYSSIMLWNGFGWHEIFRGWAAGVRIRNACWQPNVEAKGRLWFDVNGELAYIEFPQSAANPLKDSTINFNWEGAIVTSTYDAHDQNLYKILGLLRVFLDQVGGGVEIDYQTNANVGTATWTVLGTADSAPVEDLALNLGEVFQIRFRLRLQTANTRTPPVLTGWQLSGRMVPLDKYQFMCSFRADSDGETKTDEPDHSPDDVYDQLKTWATQQTKLTLHSTVRSVDNNTAGRTVTVALPTKHVRSLDTEEGKWTGDIQVAILEV